MSTETISAAPEAATTKAPAKTVLNPAAAWPFPTARVAQHLFVTVPETTLPNGTVVPAFQVGQYHCSKGQDGKVAIIASAKPWVEINYADARQACTAAGYALLTELQALAIAYNVSQQDANWSGGKVGEGKLLQGLHLDPDNVDEAYAGDYVSPDPAERRTFVLSNGQTIFDAAGNVYSWIFDDVQGDENGLVVRAFAADSPSITTAPYPSLERGIGWYPKAGSDWSGNALVRGGCWYSVADAGVFYLDLDWPDYALDSVGFRCTKPMGL
jgi:formylglycine-generating enzyme required for sulfatase activity